MRYAKAPRAEVIKRKDISILILTSVREEASRHRCELKTGRGLDVDDYVGKPTSPDVPLGRGRGAYQEARSLNLNVEA